MEGAIDNADFFALFCTAKVSPDLINKLLKASEPTKAGNCWTLIQTSSQKTFDKPTPPTLTPSTLQLETTDFLNASHSTLGTYCSTHFSQTNQNETPDSLICNDTFAVLDERSMRDETVLVCKYEMWLENKPEKPLDDTDMLELRDWVCLRVRFEHVGDFMEGVGFKDLKEFLDNDVLDEEGVWKLHD